MSEDFERKISNLYPNKRYVVRVRGKSKLGVPAPWSEALVFDTPSDSSTPNPPANLAADYTSSTLFLTWSKPQLNTDGTPFNDLSHYLIELTSGGEVVSYTTVDPFLTITPDESAKIFSIPPALIEIEVYAVDVSGKESTPAATTAEKPPTDLPTGLIAFPGFNTITLLWNISVDPGFNVFEVYASQDSDDLYDLGGGDIDDEFRVFTGNGTSYLHQGGGQNETWYFRIRAVDQLGNRSELQPNLPNQWVATTVAFVEGDPANPNAPFITAGYLIITQDGSIIANNIVANAGYIAGAQITPTISKLTTDTVNIPDGGLVGGTVAVEDVSLYTSPTGAFAMGGYAFTYTNVDLGENEFLGVSGGIEDTIPIGTPVYQGGLIGGLFQAPNILIPTGGGIQFVGDGKITWGEGSTGEIRVGADGSIRSSNYSIDDEEGWWLGSTGLTLHGGTIKASDILGSSFATVSEYGGANGVTVQGDSISFRGGSEGYAKIYSGGVPGGKLTVDSIGFLPATGIEIRQNGVFMSNVLTSVGHNHLESGTTGSSSLLITGPTNTVTTSFDSAHDHTIVHDHNMDHTHAFSI